MSNIDYKLNGHDLQLLTINLSPKESIISETGSMVYMDEGIQMNTGASLGGGLLKGVSRWFSGGGFFLTEFTNTHSSKNLEIGLTSHYPGMIMPVNLDSCGSEFMCQKQAYLCSQPSIEVSIAFTKKFRAGFFGGEGFVLQKLSGNGTAFVHAGGALYSRKLQAGEKIKIDAGCLVGFSSKVKYDIGFIGGVKNIIFGGEGLFVAELTGPGVVLIQSLPFNKFLAYWVNKGGLATRQK